MKSVLAVLIGYAIFGVSAVLLFQLAAVDPHQIPSLGFRIGSIVYGILFAFLAGYAGAHIAGKAEMKHASGVAAIIALLAVISIIAQPGLESHWSQYSALILMAPAAIAGGWFRKRQTKANTPE